MCCILNLSPHLLLRLCESVYAILFTLYLGYRDQLRIAALPTFETGLLTSWCRVIRWRRLVMSERLVRCFYYVLWLITVWAEPVVYTWKNRTILPINELAIINGQEFPNIDFAPPLMVRKDGSLFLTVTVVDNDAWINIALNSFVSLAKLHNVSGLTIMTMNDRRLATIFRKLGLYAYDATSTISTFPADFNPEQSVASWSWGAIIFLRFNAWIEAFRRGIGFCSIDTDVTYNREVLFVRHRDQQYADITTQGHIKKVNPKSKNKCKLTAVQDFCVSPDYAYELSS